MVENTHHNLILFYFLDENQKIPTAGLGLCCQFIGIDLFNFFLDKADVCA